MVTIKEFEVFLNAKLMAANLSKIAAKSQWLLIEDVEKIVRDVITELGLDDAIRIHTNNSTIKIFARLNYTKEELGIEEGIARQLGWSWCPYDLFQIKVKKTKEKVKGVFTGDVTFKEAVLIADDTTKTIDEVILVFAKALQEKEDEEEKIRQQCLEDNRDKWRNFYTKTLADNGVTIEAFFNIKKEHYTLPFITEAEQDEILKEITQKEAL